MFGTISCNHISLEHPTRHKGYARMIFQAIKLKILRVINNFTLARRNKNMVVVLKYKYNILYNSQQLRAVDYDPTYHSNPSLIKKKANNDEN